MNISSIKLQLNSQTLEKFIELFQAASERPQMYFYPCSYDCVNCSLNWFRAAFHHAGFIVPDFRDEIGLERGWRSNALGFQPDMRKKGLSDIKMAKELLIIESENWKRVLHELKNR